MLATPRAGDRLPSFDEVCDEFATSREAALALEQRAIALAGSRGRRRARVCQLCDWLTRARSWERLGFARLRDYADERLGVSVREIQDFARVGRALERAPALEIVLCAGTLPWSKVRLLARLADRGAGRGAERDGQTPPDLSAWIDAAKSLSCAALAKAIARERPAADASRSVRGVERVDLVLSRGTWAWWTRAAQLGRRQAGHELGAGALLEQVAAEWLSAYPLERPIETSHALDAAAGRHEDGSSKRRGTRRVDPFPLDERLRALIAAEQRLDAQLGRCLSLLRERALHRDRGFQRFDAYARERFGLAPRKLQMLLRIDRACAKSRVLEDAYRHGAVSWTQADLLVPLIELDQGGDWHAAWVSRARRVSVRRLRCDVAAATSLERTDPAAFARSGGLPDADDPRLEREVPRPDGDTREGDADLCVPFTFFAGADVRALVLGAVFSAQQQLARRYQAPVSVDGALRALFQHACAAWGDGDPVPREHRVFDRDAWRCQMPGCSSRRNLHAHHITFASHGGPTRPDNLVTLCAWHHLRGVHRGIVGVSGEAPDRLRFTLGLRPPRAPLAVFQGGDRRLTAL